MILTDKQFGLTFTIADFCPDVFITCACTCLRKYGSHCKALALFCPLTIIHQTQAVCEAEAWLEIAELSLKENVTLLIRCLYACLYCM